MPAKYLNFLALSAIVFLACSFGTTPVAALSVDNGLHARHARIGQSVARRGTNQRCKARSASGSAVVPASSTPPAYTPKPTTTTTPQAPAPTPAASSGGGGGGKACLAFSYWDDTVPTILANFKTSHVSCIYNWTPNLVPGAAQKGYTDAPMLWGTKDLDQWKQLVVPGYASVVLGFNEPDLQSQSYMDPGYACTLWQQNMLPLRNEGYTLVSPVTTSSPKGIDWMHSFLGACGAGSVDKIALHWYGVDPQLFIQYLQLWYNTFQKPVWVTEFACQDFSGSGQSCTDVQGFARTVRGFMDNTWWVEHYAPFAVAPSLGNVNAINALVDGNLGMTELAKIYFD